MRFSKKIKVLAFMLTVATTFTQLYDFFSNLIASLIKENSAATPNHVTAAASMPEPVTTAASATATVIPQLTPTATALLATIVFMIFLMMAAELYFNDHPTPQKYFYFMLPPALVLVSVVFNSLLIAPLILLNIIAIIYTILLDLRPPEMRQ